MIRSLHLPLLIALMMFPQIVETIYSPALTDIATTFNINPTDAGQTLSLYFIAFAFGIIIWGYLCDCIGRRPTFLIALSLYGLSTGLAIFVTSFEGLLACRIIMAFSAAIGSIGTQVMIRDSFSGDALRNLFAIMGIALAISPMLGFFLGSILVFISGYQAVFIALVLIAVILFNASAILLPETKPNDLPTISLLSTAKKMLQDQTIFKNAILVGCFNIALFSYYQLAPFIFKTLNINQTLFGLSGIALGIGSFIGAFINKKLIKTYQLNSHRIIFIASIIMIICSTLTWLLESSCLFILFFSGITIAYSIAIPNILANALIDYQHTVGKASALFGLMYYIIIGVGLIVVAYTQQLGLSLIALSILILITQGYKSFLKYLC